MHNFDVGSKCENKKKCFSLDNLYFPRKIEVRDKEKKKQKPYKKQCRTPTTAIAELMFGLCILYLNAHCTEF